MSPIQPLLVLSTEGRTGECRPIRAACLGFLYSVLEESFETNPKGLKEKDVRKCFVLLCFNVGFTRARKSRRFSSENKRSLLQLLKKPLLLCSPETKEYNSLSDPGRSGELRQEHYQFLSLACFDLWSSDDLKTCILLRKSTDAAQDSKETRLLIDTYLVVPRPCSVA